MGTFATLRQLRAEGAKQRQIAKALGLSRARVSNIERVINKSTTEWLEWVERKRLTYKHLEAVLTLPVARADALLRAAMAGHWSANRLRQEVRIAKGARRTEDPHPDADVAYLENKLSELLATRVAIRTTAGRGGELVLTFTDADTLDGLLERLGYRAE